MVIYSYPLSRLTRVVAQGAIKPGMRELQDGEAQEQTLDYAFGASLWIALWCAPGGDHDGIALSLR